MSRYDVMKKRLADTGLYEISDESNISKELKAYAKELDRVKEELDELSREMFIDTAIGYGLDERERFFGLVRTEYTVEQRREMLTTANQLSGEMCTIEKFKKFLGSCGLKSFEISESTDKQKIMIKINDVLTPAEQENLKKRVKGEIPIRVVPVYKFLNEA